MLNIKNTKIISFLENYFQKNIRDISDDDIGKVQKISISGSDVNNQLQWNKDDLSIFSNLQYINVVDSMIYERDIDILCSIPNIRFTRCAFQSEDDLSKLTNTLSLEFYNCYFARYSFLHNLSQLQLLSIIKPESEAMIDCSSLSNYSNLQSLDLQFCKINHFSDIQNCKELIQLSLIGTELSDDYADIFEKLPNLKDLFINDKYLVSDRDNINVHSDYSEFLFDDDDNQNEDFNQKVF